jgi:hypothetical protein
MRLMMSRGGGCQSVSTPETMFVMERTAKAVQRHSETLGVFAMLPRGESPVHHN